MSHTHPFQFHVHPHPHHHHDPSDEDTYETANQHHFDATAHQYDDHPDAQRRAAHIGQAMIDTRLFKQGITTVMDFACGTGISIPHSRAISLCHSHRSFPQVSSPAYWRQKTPNQSSASISAKAWSINTTRSSSITVSRPRK